MIEPDRAGMPHRGAQHFAKRLEGLLLQAGGVEAGKAPALAGGVERIRRRADAEMARDRHLFVPGIEAVGLHADRDVEIKPDLHARACARDPWHAASCRSAVHCTNSTNSISAASAPLRRLGASGLVRLPPLLAGHSHHGLLNLCRSTSKQAKRDNSGARSRAEFLELLPARFVSHRALKASNADRSARHFNPATAGIIDDVACPQLRQRIPRRGVEVKFRNFLDDRYRAH